MTNLMVELLVNYVKAGIIGWAVWFVLSVSYIVASFKLDVSLYHSCERHCGVTEEGGKKKCHWTIGSVIQIILWPYGICAKSVALDRMVREELKRNK